MDTLAHGLWATAAAKANNRFAQRKFRTGWFVFWGVLPDLFSFTPAVAWLLWQVIIEGIPFAKVPRPELLPPEVRMTFPVFRLTNALYHLSHSLIIFAGIFLLVWAIRRYWLKSRQAVPMSGSLHERRRSLLGNDRMDAAHPDRHTNPHQALVSHAVSLAAV